MHTKKPTKSKAYNYLILFNFCIHTIGAQDKSPPEQGEQRQELASLAKTGYRLTPANRVIGKTAALHTHRIKQITAIKYHRLGQ